MSSTAAYPRWVLLEPYAKTNLQDSSCVTADAKTLAAATTSTGHRIHVSLAGLAEAPATSALRIELPDGGDHIEDAIIIAAHGDSLLVQVGYCIVDLFVYRAGAGAADPPRPPSLLLLPPFYGTGYRSGYRVPHATGILRRGEDEIIVADLRPEAASNDTPETKAVKLSMFRSGEWGTRLVRISSSKTTIDLELLDKVLSQWNPYAVFIVPVGDRTLCWVELTCSILLCDVLEDNPLLQFIPLPAVPFFYLKNKQLPPCLAGPSHRNLRATASGVLKFVNIFPRCCCGSAGATLCQHSKNAYTIQTWTLRMDVMEWVMDATVDATELLELDAYKGLPRVPLDYPVMNMDEPHVICFLLCESHHVKRGGGDRTQWLLTVDTRSKTILSVSRHLGQWLPGRPPLIPSSVSYYLNSHPTCSSHMPTGQGRTSQMDTEKHKDDDDSRNPMMRSSFKSSVEPSVQASEILEALQELPSYGLCRDDMLKAYSILSHGDGRRCRSFLALPLTLRKDWLLMEIQAGDA